MRFSAVTAGFRHSCGVRTDGTIMCWGNRQHEAAQQYSGVEFSAVTAANHTCGLRTDGTIICWGADFGSQSTGMADVPSGQYTAVTAGMFHSCGLRTDGTVACWGSNQRPGGSYGGPAAPPSGLFAAITAGDFPFVWAAHRRHHRLLGRQPGGPDGRTGWAVQRGIQRPVPARAGCAPTAL